MVHHQREIYKKCIVMFKINTIRSCSNKYLFKINVSKKNCNENKVLNSEFLNSLY